MRLEAFRVQNFKKVRDTGKVTLRDLTCFVGKNESGKSSIFRGLSKLNPSDGEKLNGLKEFPRRRYTSEFKQQDWPVATGWFVLSSEDRAKLATFTPLLKDVERVEVTRHYSNQLSVGFEPGHRVKQVMLAELRETIEGAIDAIRALTAPEGKGEALAPLKTSALNGLTQSKAAIGGANGVASRAQVDQAMNVVAAQANEEWSKKTFEPTLAPFRRLGERASSEEKLASARNWVAANLPRFVYFDNYHMLDSAVHVPTFIQQLQQNSSLPRVRTTNCLFKHVGLDPFHLNRLGSQAQGHAYTEAVKQYFDERAILASSASNAMTEKFRHWWEQRHHVFRYGLDGDHLRVWVSDDMDPSEIELDQRSAGMQYFFSFYLVFLVEAQDAHANSILLLDEPGLHLHGTAQGAVVRFLEKLSKENQTLYTTHSPFMVDVNHLERVRAVYEAQDGTTRISEDVWPRDKDTLFPLQAALGYQVVQSLFIAPKQVIVEGMTDMWLLKALNHALGHKGRVQLSPTTAILPAAGATKMAPLASLLLAHDVAFVALLDGDEPARRAGKKLSEQLFNGDGTRCLFVADVLGVESGEIEDVFAGEDYFSAVKLAYPGLELDFTPTERLIPGVVNRMEALFKRQSLGVFEKVKVAALLRDWVLENPDKLSPSTVDAAERLLLAVNNSLGDKLADVQGPLPKTVLPEAR